MLGTGFVLALIRMIDPYYRTVLYTVIMEFFGKVIEKSKVKKIRRQPLSSYLAQSLNLELINIILQGITNFSLSDYSETDERFRMKFKKLNKHTMRMLELDKITIN